MTSAINQTAFVSDHYANTEIHKYLLSLISILDYRRNVALKMTRFTTNDKGKEEFIKLLEHCNKQIMEVLNIPLPDRD